MDETLLDIKIEKLRNEFGFEQHNSVYECRGDVILIQFEVGWTTASGEDITKLIIQEHQKPWGSIDILPEAVRSRKLGEAATSTVIRFECTENTIKDVFQAAIEIQKQIKEAEKNHITNLYESARIAEVTGTKITQIAS